jgi:hypothetical protein
VALLVVVLVVGGVIALGWWQVVSALDVPWFIGLPLSMVAGAAFLGWQVATTWRGYLLTAGLAVVGCSWFVAWLIVDAI